MIQLTLAHISLTHFAGMPTCLPQTCLEFSVRIYQNLLPRCVRELAPIHGTLCLSYDVHNITGRSSTDRRVESTWSGTWHDWLDISYSTSFHPALDSRAWTEKKGMELGGVRPFSHLLRLIPCCTLCPRVRLQAPEASTLSLRHNCSLASKTDKDSYSKTPFCPHLFASLLIWNRALVVAGWRHGEGNLYCRGEEGSSRGRGDQLIRSFSCGIELLMVKCPVPLCFILIYMNATT